MQSRWWQIAFTALSFACAGCSETGPSASEESAARAKPPAAAERSAARSGIAAPWIDEWRKDAFAGKDVRATWERYARAVQAELDKPGADPSDTAAKAQQLGRDIQKVFEFIRDDIALEPYAGVLRGPRGTLMAEAGNSLDRALLAQELLEVQGVESRLVAGKLSDAQADALLARFATDRLPGALADLIAPSDDAAFNSVGTRLSAATGLSESSIAELLRKAQAQTQELWSRVEAETAKQFSIMDVQLRQANVNRAVDRLTLSSVLKERMRDHYWLQVRDASGAWSNFDPSFPDARPGEARASEAKVMVEVPKEEFHVLQFDLVSVSKVDGELKPEVLVSATVPSADAVFKPLEFRIQPANLGTDLNTLARMNGRQRIEFLRSMARFQGLFRAGDAVTVSRVFDLAGNTYDSADSPAGPSNRTFFGDAFGGGEAAAPQFVELRVVIRMTGPGREPRSQTRTLIRAPDVGRPEFAPPLLEWQILLQPQWLTAELAGRHALIGVLEAGKALASASGTGRRITSFQSPSPDPALLQLALLRQIAAARDLVRQDGLRAFIDEPLLTISGQRLRAIDEAKGLIIAERHVDIVENAIRYLGNSEAAQAAAFTAALRQAAADSIIEDSFLEAAFPGSARLSAIAVLKQAKAEHRPMMLVRPQDIDRMRSAGVSEADIEWIYDHEPSAARLLIATTGNGANAWWSIRPDGNAILRANGGYGQGMVETALNTAKVGLAVICVIQLGLTDYNARQQSAGIWSEEGSDRVTYCLLATTLAGGLFVGGLMHHGVHILSLALIGYEVIHLSRQ